MISGTGCSRSLQQITLRELLTHTAGVTVHGFPGYASNEPVPSLVQVLNGEKPANTPAIRSEQPPGKKWKYSGGGYTIMQQILIDVTKEPFPKLLDDTVLAPIGMNRSTYEQPLPPSLRENAATPLWRRRQASSGRSAHVPGDGCRWFVEMTFQIAIFVRPVLILNIISVEDGWLPAFRIQHLLDSRELLPLNMPAGSTRHVRLNLVCHDLGSGSRELVAMPNLLGMNRDLQVV